MIVVAQKRKDEEEEEEELPLMGIHVRFWFSLRLMEMFLGLAISLIQTLTNTSRRQRPGAVVSNKPPETRALLLLGV